MNESPPVAEAAESTTDEAESTTYEAEAERPEVSQETAVMLEVLRELTAQNVQVLEHMTQTLSGHIARQNLWFDKIQHTISVGNCALEVMLGDMQRAVYNTNVTELQRRRDERLQQLRDAIQQGRADGEGESPPSPVENGSQ